jgi:hypothetical protein
MKLVLGLIALAAIPFEIYTALHHLHGEPILYTWTYFAAVVLTLAACGFGMVDVWHNVKRVKEEREALSIFLILPGLLLLCVSFVVFFGSTITLHTLVTWPLWTGAAALTAIAVGALLAATLDPVSFEEQLNLFEWRRRKDEQEAREKKAEEARKHLAELRECYKSHPEEAPPRMPNPNNLNRPYIS